MSNLLSHMSAKTIQATLHGKKVVIQVAKTFGLANYATNSQIERLEAKFQRKSDYFIDCDASSFDEYLAQKVYKMPQDYLGHHDEHDLKNMQVIGVIFGKKRGLRVETDLEVVETVRRENVARGMLDGAIYWGAKLDANLNPIGEPIGRDVKKYRDYLANLDKENHGVMKTHGYELDVCVNRVRELLI